VWALSLISLPLLLLGGGAVVAWRRAPGAAAAPASELEQALAAGREGERLFRAWNRAVAAEATPGEVLALHEGARVHLQRGLEELQRLLERPEHRDADGELRPELRGWEEHLQRWAVLLVDLERGALLGARSAGG
jgi:hypothetical protein